jgi:uncharacterized protein (TIGR02246 family)
MATSGPSTAVLISWVLGFLGGICGVGPFAVVARAEDQVGDCVKLSEVQIVQLLNSWRAAFISGSAEQLSALYSDDAILIAIKDGKAYKGRDAILAYYKEFLARKPRLSLRPAVLEAGCRTATVSGPVVYRITGQRKGTRELLGGRYQTEFRKVGDKWQIVRHSLAADPRAIGEAFDGAASGKPSPPL